jgi:hypothetical protein
MQGGGSLLGPVPAAKEVTVRLAASVAAGTTASMVFWGILLPDRDATRA